MSEEPTQKKINPHLAVVHKHWHILPWHFKTRIYLVCLFSYWKYKIRNALNAAANWQAE